MFCHFGISEMKKNHWTYMSGKWHANYRDYIVGPESIKCPGCKKPIKLIKASSIRWNIRNYGDSETNGIHECGTELVLQHNVF